MTLETDHCYHLPSWLPVFWSVNLLCAPTVLLIISSAYLTAACLESAEECLRAVSQHSASGVAVPTPQGFAVLPEAVLQALLQSLFQACPASNYHTWALCNPRLVTMLTSMVPSNNLWGLWVRTHFLDTVFASLLYLTGPLKWGEGRGYLRGTQGSWVFQFAFLRWNELFTVVLGASLCLYVFMSVCQLTVFLSLCAVWPQHSGTINSSSFLQWFLTPHYSLWRSQ